MVTRTYLVRGDKADNGAVIVGGSSSTSGTASQLPARATPSTALYASARA